MDTDIFDPRQVGLCDQAGVFLENRLYDLFIQGTFGGLRGCFLRNHRLISGIRLDTHRGTGRPAATEDHDISYDDPCECECDERPRARRVPGGGILPKHRRPVLGIQRGLGRCRHIVFHDKLAVTIFTHHDLGLPSMGSSLPPQEGHINLVIFMINVHPCAVFSVYFSCKGM